LFLIKAKNHDYIDLVFISNGNFKIQYRLNELELPVLLPSAEKTE